MGPSLVLGPQRSASNPKRLESSHAEVRKLWHNLNETNSINFYWSSNALTELTNLFIDGKHPHFQSTKFTKNEKP